jgi:hypothetical protein
VTILRRALVASATAALLALVACAPGQPGEKVEDESLIHAARDLVALLGGYNCALLPNFLPTGAPLFFQANIGPTLMDGMQDPVERVCFVLGVIQRYPASETMDVRADTLSDTRASLILLGDQREAELRLVREGGAWKLDREWALAQVQDLEIEQALRTFAIAQDEFYYYGDRRFTDDQQVLTARTHTPSQFGRGIAVAGGPPMLVFGALGPNAQSVCGSSVSLSGELFMIRQAGDGSTSYDRGPSLPPRCPAKRMKDSW